MDIKEEEFVPRTMWRSCCIDADKAALVFFSQISVGGGILAFCAYIIASDPYDSSVTCPAYGLINMILLRVLTIQFGA